MNYSVDALMTEHEQDLLYKFIQEFSPKSYLEIGSYKGGSLAIARQAKADMVMYSIEPNPLFNDSDVKIIKDYTPSAFEKLDRKFEVILVDGNHAKEAVINDIINAMRYLEPNGVLICHDTSFTGVRAAIDAVKEQGYIYVENLLSEGDSYDNDGNLWGGLTVLYPDFNDHVVKYNRQLSYRMDTYDLMILSEMDTQYNQVPYEQVQTVIDVGAHIGFYTNKVKHMSPNATVIAIEMANDNFDILVRNTEGLESVYLEHACLTYELDFKAMRWQDGNTGSGKIITPTMELPENTIELAVSNATLTLEDIIHKYKLKHIDVLKLDCEGSEFSIFSNMSKRASKMIDMIVGEYHADYQFAFDRISLFCVKHGFELKEMSQTDGLGFFYMEKKS